MECHVETGVVAEARACICWIPVFSRDGIIITATLVFDRILAAICGRYRVLLAFCKRLGKQNVEVGIIVLIFLHKCERLTALISNALDAQGTKQIEWNGTNVVA